MSRVRNVWSSSSKAGLVLYVASLLPGCGGGTQEPPPFTPKDAPAVEGKDSMDYYRNKMKKPGGVRR